MKNLRKFLVFVLFALATVAAFGFSSVKAATEVARFEFGTDDASKTDESQSAQDGSSANTYTETSGTYTLSLSSMTNVYKDAYDAKGNACLKLGTSKKTGSFTFAVPEDVEQVVILVAGYKAKTVTVSVNGVSTNVTTTSSNGAYTEVTVDTSSTKTVTFTTSTNYRCKVDAIVYYAAGVSTEPAINIQGENFTEVDDVVALTAATANITGAVAWTSSNEEVATVDENGNVTALSVGTTTIKAEADGVSDEIEFTVFPADGSELTIAEAIEVCELTGQTNCAFTYSTTGVVESIDSAYSSQYNNITVTITDGTDSIKAFRMVGGATLTVGTKIKVTGVLVNYYGNTPEFVQGCTYEDLSCVVGVQTAEAENGAQHIRLVGGLNVNYEELTSLSLTITDATDATKTVTVEITNVFGTLVANTENGIAEITAESQGFECLFAFTITNVPAGTTLNVTATYTTETTTFTSAVKTVAVPAAE